MSWGDALKVGVWVVAFLGGGSVVVWAILQAFGAVILQARDARYGDQRSRLEAVLSHRNEVRQRLLDLEVGALVALWAAVAQVQPRVNALANARMISQAEVKRRVDQLSDAHNEALSAAAAQRLLLSRDIVDAAHTVLRVARREMDLVRRSFPLTNAASEEAWERDRRRGREEAAATTERLFELCQVRKEALLAEGGREL